jgi:hypothetical protein
LRALRTQAPVRRCSSRIEISFMCDMVTRQREPVKVDARSGMRAQDVGQGGADTAGAARGNNRGAPRRGPDDGARDNRRREIGRRHAVQERGDQSPHERAGARPIGSAKCGDPQRVLHAARPRLDAGRILAILFSKSCRP